MTLRARPKVALTVGVLVVPPDKTTDTLPGSGYPPSKAYRSCAPLLSMLVALYSVPTDPDGTFEQLSNVNFGDVSVVPKFLTLQLVSLT
ncbi:MAG: hypothetical protein ACK55I_02135, partial [bacterium]